MPRGLLADPYEQELFRKLGRRSHVPYRLPESQTPVMDQEVKAGLERLKQAGRRSGLKPTDRLFNASLLQDVLAGASQVASAPVTGLLQPVLGPALQGLGAVADQIPLPSNLLTYKKPGDKIDTVGSAARQTFSKAVGLVDSASDAIGYPREYGREAALAGAGLLAPSVARGVGRVADAAEGLINKAGYTFKPQEGTRLVFGGPTALTADSAALAKFDTLFGRGNTSHEKMWQNTGWGIAPDGHRFFEIDDSASRIISDIDKLPQGEVPIKSVLEHRLLFDAYPQLSNIRVQFDPSTSGGQFYNNVMTIGTKGADANSLRRTFIHELNHAVQAIEGFDPGTNPLMVGHASYYDSMGETAARNAEARADLTAAQRRKSFPDETADTPRDQQLSRRQIQSLMERGGFKRGVEIRQSIGDGKFYLVDRSGEWGTQGYATMGEAARALKLADDGILAYHGSPHSFDKFDMSKIGTGEGAQAYGHGLYFAEAEDVAKTYRDMLSDQPTALPAVDWKQRASWTELQDDAYGLADRALEELQIDIAQGGSTRPDWARLTDKVRQLAPSGKEQEILGELNAMADKYGWKEFVNKNPGSMYQVRLNVKPDELLDWDKPLREQPKAIADAALSIRNEAAIAEYKRRGLSQDLIEEYIDNATNRATYGDMSGRHVMNVLKEHGLSAQATAKLKASGVKGIRYLDQGSRGARFAPKLSYNYVVFDDKLITILKKYGIPMTAGAGGAVMVSGQDMPPELAAQMAPAA